MGLFLTSAQTHLPQQPVSLSGSIFTVLPLTSIFAGPSPEFGENASTICLNNISKASLIPILSFALVSINCKFYVLAWFLPSSVETVSGSIISRKSILFPIIKIWQSGLSFLIRSIQLVQASNDSLSVMSYTKTAPCAPRK